jgi:hypothetical protein
VGIDVIWGKGMAEESTVAQGASTIFWHSIPNISWGGGDEADLHFQKKILFWTLVE